MNKLLANIAVLNQKTYNLHWNVRGIGFMDAHKITEALYEELTLQFDIVAEKIAMSGVTPLSTFKAYIENADIVEIEPRAFTAKEVFEILNRDFIIFKKSILDVKITVENQTVIDELVQMIDKQAWLIKSSI